MEKIKVLNVDDALSVRMVLRELLSKVADIELVGQAKDAMEAKQMLHDLQPDVITLDVEMPGMSGIEFLEKLMKLRPTPVVMLSTLTQQGSETALKALELGAVEVIGKPSAKGTDLRTYQDEILTKIRAAAAAQVGGTRKPRKVDAVAAALQPGLVTPLLSADAILPESKKIPTGRPPIIAVGASTGGTEAIKELLNKLDANLPGIVVTQHMSAGFTASFAKRLDKFTPFAVHEAKDGMPIEDGHVYIAPGGAHLGIRYVNGAYRCQIYTGSAVNRHLPAVDVMMRSVTNEAGNAALGTILTGMGSDGAAGLLELKNAGGRTMAQDAASCVVYGMPKAAVENNAAQNSYSLETMATKIKEYTA